MGEVRGLPVASDEDHVNRQQLAKMMGVSVSTIKRLDKEGMPSVSWGRRCVRYLPSVAMAWARERDARSDGEAA